MRVKLQTCTQFNVEFLFFKRFYLWERERERERERQRHRQRHRQREKQAPCREPNVGLDPRSLGSHWAEGRHQTTEPPRDPWEVKEISKGICICESRLTGSWGVGLGCPLPLAKYEHWGSWIHRGMSLCLFQGLVSVLPQGLCFVLS